VELKELKVQLQGLLDKGYIPGIDRWGSTIEGGKFSPASAHGLKGRNGPGHFLGRVGRITVGAAQCNSVIFLFPIKLIQFNFKSNSNF
jgi:hypothetical protein